MNSRTRIGKFHLAAVPWSIHLVAPTHKKLDGNAGVALYNECRLLISRALSPELRRETIMHEVLHAVFYSSGASNQIQVMFGEGEDGGASYNFEEILIQALAPGLFQVICQFDMVKA